MTFTPLGTLIFVDDDPALRAANVQSLELAGFEVVAFDSARAALAGIDATFNGAIVSDIRMPDIDGLQFFQQVREIDPTIPFLLITGHGDIAMAVAALREGAHDFLAKPFAADHLVASVTRALERRRLELDNRALRAQLESPDHSSPLLGETPGIVRLRQAIERIAEADVDVLVEGETGTGKELVALMLHRGSARRANPFITVNCGAVSSEMASIQLFGGAAGRTSEQSRIEAANRGTLFIDEIDRLDQEAQAGLLRVIEDRTVLPGGASTPRPLSLRIIVASRHDLHLAAQEGTFREDLFYAINVVRLRIPPLRERRGDIPLLFAHFLEAASVKLRRPPPPLSERHRQYLLEHDWPGNVRELRSFALQAALGFEQIAGVDEPQDEATLPVRVERFEASIIRTVLEQCRGNAAVAVARLGIPRKTFYDKLSRHGIEIKSYR